jgi:hypothetical protein
MSVKNLVALMSALVMLLMVGVPQSQASVVVPGQLNFDGHITPVGALVDTAFTQSSWTEQVTLTDGGSGESATINITMSDTSGVNWWPIGNIATVGGDGWIDSVDAPILFTATLVSQSAGVLSVGFHITSAGMLPLGTSNVSWSSNATLGPVVNVVTSDADYLLDGTTDFHNLSTAYSGSFTTSSLIQLSGTGSNGTGLHFAALLTLPEPASASLLAMGGLLLLRRKK